MGFLDKESWDEAWEKRRGQSISSKFDTYKYTSSDQAKDSNYVPPYIRRKMKANEDRQKKVNNILDGSGPLSVAMIMILDKIISIFVEIFESVMVIFWDGFEWLYDLFFGLYYGLFSVGYRHGDSDDPNQYNIKANGFCFSMKYFRYLITFLTPPLGVFFAKGIKGWFSIIICIILCYFHYLLGIIYAFVLTSRSRYADKYEKKQLDNIKKFREKAKENAIKDGEVITKEGTTKYYAGLIFMVIIVFLIYIILRKI